MARLPSPWSACCALLAGCSIGDDEGGGPPQIGVKADDEDAATELGFPVTATKNTTRVAGGDAVADAAGVANAVFPATSDATRPKAVALVDKDNWQGGRRRRRARGRSHRRPDPALRRQRAAGRSRPDTLDRLQPRGADAAQTRR